MSTPGSENKKEGQNKKLGDKKPKRIFIQAKEAKSKTKEAEKEKKKKGKGQ